MIFRFYLKWILVLILPFLTLTGLIRSHPYDDNGLSNILISPCPSVCFLNIVPGVTTGDEAFDTLSTHPWVTNVVFTHSTVGNSDDRKDGVMTWSWTGLEPPILRSPYLVVGEVTIVAGFVDSIRVRTAIPFAAVWLTLGWPPNGWIRPSVNYLHKYDDQVAVYPERGLEIRSLVNLPLREDSFWNAPIDLYFETFPPDNFRYARPCWWACIG